MLDELKGEFGKLEECKNELDKLDGLKGDFGKRWMS